MLENTFLITFFINFDFTSLFLLIVCFFFFITVLLGTKYFQLNSVICEMIRK